VTAFPQGFLWGAATSAYQIEGSPLADGAGASNWHRFSHLPGKIEGGDNGDRACDHYRRWREDVALMRELGLGAYRFSLGWGRLQPEGRGKVHIPGRDFYSRLIDELLESGIRPMVTLHHWDFPQTLDERGGWPNRDSIEWFADYAEIAFRAYADRVSLWTTFNEPWMISDSGYLRGLHAPGRRSAAEAALTAHHLLCAHGEAVARFRSMAKGEIGLVVNLEPKHPASDSPADVAAAMRADAYMNRQYLDPIFLGSYPPELAECFGRDWPRHGARDFERIRQPIDYLGINYYSRGVTRDDPADLPIRAPRVPMEHAERTAMGWEVYPDGLREILVWVRRRYGEVPLYVTENGAAYGDSEPAAGVVEDPRRVDYLRSHLRAAREAIDEGVDLRGYFAWSLLDNFEWGFGYSKRFGLVRVDFETQQRWLKRSGLFFRHLARTNGAGL
jgi:beta-glucosidase